MRGRGFDGPNPFAHAMLDQFLRRLDRRALDRAYEQLWQALERQGGPQRSATARVMVGERARWLRETRRAARWEVRRRRAVDAL